MMKSNPNQPVTTSSFNRDPATGATNQVKVQIKSYDLIHKPEIENAGTDPQADELQFKQSSLFKINPIARGLTLVHVEQVSMLCHVRAALTELLLQHSDVLGLELPMVPYVLSLHSGRPRLFEQARYLMSSISCSPDVTHQFHYCSTQSNLDWTSSAGECVLLPIIEKTDGIVILELNAEDKRADDVFHGFTRISAEAKAANKHVMLLFAGLKAAGSPQIWKFSDEYLEVSQCENDADALLTFSIECIGLSELYGSGIGKVMCCVSQQGGGFQRQYTPFVSNDLKTRIMWALRGQGKSLEEIGQYFNVHKTSVQRRLKGLPPPRRSFASDDWLARNLEWVQASSPSKHGTGAGQAMEVVIGAA
jgi:hypothetical protein